MFLESEIPQISGLVVPIAEPKDVWDRRRMIEEYKALALPLWDVELMFYNELFREDCPFTYDELYQQYQYIYSELAVVLTNQVKPKFLGINPHYFNQFSS